MIKSLCSIQYIILVGYESEEILFIKFKGIQSNNILCLLWEAEKKYDKLSSFKIATVHLLWWKNCLLMLTWSNYCFSVFNFLFLKHQEWVALIQWPFGVVFLFLFSPCGHSVEAVAKGLWKQRWQWILYYYPGSLCFPCFNCGNLSCLLIGKFSMDRNIFHLSLHHCCFPHQYN